MQTGKKEKKQMLLVEHLIGTEKRNLVSVINQSGNFICKKNKVLKCHPVVKSSLHLCWKNS